MGLPPWVTLFVFLFDVFCYMMVTYVLFRGNPFFDMIFRFTLFCDKKLYQYKKPRTKAPLFPVRGFLFIILFNTKLNPQTPATSISRSALYNIHQKEIHMC